MTKCNGGHIPGAMNGALVTNNHKKDEIARIDFLLITYFSRTRDLVSE